MRILILSVLGLGLGAVASPAAARDYCPDRPGLDTPPCTIEPGRFSVEMSGVDWTRDDSGDTISDTLLVGDLALRFGIADHAELRFAWTPYGHVHTRDRTTGAVDNQSSTGDVTLGLKRNLLDPTGKNVSVAVLPFVSLPSGGQAIGAGDWGAGLQLPVSVPLTGAVSFALTPEIDAAVDGDRNGRHLAFGTAAGFAIQPRDGVNFAVETAVIRDEDPAGTTTQALAGASVGLMLGKNFQVDAGTVIGLNHAAPDTELYVGLARRF
jgi:hypothetical protein